MIVASTLLSDSYLVWWAAQIVSIAIIVYLVLRWRPKFLRGQTVGQTLNSTLAAREDQIRQQLAAAEESRREAARIREEAAHDIDVARGQAEEIVNRAHHTSEAIQHEIVARSEQEAQRIVQQAQADIEYETRQAEMALRRRAADIVVDAAERIVERHLEPTTDRRLIDQSLANLRDIG